MLSQIKEKFNDLEALVLGNRVTCLGRLVLISNIISIPTYLNAEVTYPCTSLIFGAAVLGGLISEYETNYGLRTYKIYKRTKNHIRKFGKLNEKFVKKITDDIPNEGPAGYCEWQGIYLAARDMNKTEEFQKIKKEYDYQKPIPLI